MTEAGLRAVEAAKKDGLWEIAYSSKETVPVPQDLAEALKKEAGAEEGYARWSSSARLQAIYWIRQARRPETRRKRLAAVVRCAAEGRKVEDAAAVQKEMEEDERHEG